MNLAKTQNIDRMKYPICPWLVWSHGDHLEFRSSLQ